jgi:hypothetical protein
MKLDVCLAGKSHASLTQSMLSYEFASKHETDGSVLFPTVVSEKGWGRSGFC